MHAKFRFGIGEWKATATTVFQLRVDLDHESKMDRKVDIRKFHADLSRRDSNLDITFSLRDDAFLIVEDLLKANSTEAALQHLCLLDQLLLPRPRWHQVEIRSALYNIWTVPFFKMPNEISPNTPCLNHSFMWVR